MHSVLQARCAWAKPNHAFFCCQLVQRKFFTQSRGPVRGMAHPSASMVALGCTGKVTRSSHPHLHLCAQNTLNKHFRNTSWNTGRCSHARWAACRWSVQRSLNNARRRLSFFTRAPPSKTPSTRNCAKNSRPWATPKTKRPPCGGLIAGAASTPISDRHLPALRHKRPGRAGR